VTNFDWAKLGVKLVGLWLMISALMSVTNVLEAIYTNQSGVTIPFAVIVSALRPLAAGLGGLYLWTYSDGLASSIFPKVGGGEIPGAEDPERLLPLALSLMGIWLLGEAIPTLVHNIALSLLSLTAPHLSVFGPIYQPPVIPVTMTANSIAALVRGFIGCGLILGRKRLAEVISAMRGRSEPI
jgi:hypothetical protein